MSEKLTDIEAEFVSEMSDGPPPEEPWRHFDPGFRQSDIRRLIRRGWFETRGEGRDREYRWTPAGRAAPAPSPPSPPRRKPMAEKRSRRHERKQCFLCEQRLTRVAKDGCAAIWGRDQCWWEPTIREHGLDEAVRMSNELRSSALSHPQNKGESA